MTQRASPRLPSRILIALTNRGILRGPPVSVRRSCIGQPTQLLAAWSRWGCPAVRVPRHHVITIQISVMLLVRLRLTRMLSVRGRGVVVRRRYLRMVLLRRRRRPKGNRWLSLMG